MLAVRRVHGIDQLLRTALENGTILYGSSPDKTKPVDLVTLTMGGNDAGSVT